MLFQDAHDSILEQARELALAKVVLIIQRVMFGLHDRYCILEQTHSERESQRSSYRWQIPMGDLVCEGARDRLSG